MAMLAREWTSQGTTLREEKVELSDAREEASIWGMIDFDALRFVFTRESLVVVAGMVSRRGEPLEEADEV